MSRSRLRLRPRTLPAATFGAVTARHGRPIRYVSVGRFVIAWEVTRVAADAWCFCGHPTDLARVHRAHACEPWATSATPSKPTATDGRYES